MADVNDNTQAPVADATKPNDQGQSAAPNAAPPEWTPDRKEWVELRQEIRALRKSKEAPSQASATASGDIAAEIVQLRQELELRDVYDSQKVPVELRQIMTRLYRAERPNDANEFVSSTLSQIGAINVRREPATQVRVDPKAINSPSAPATVPAIPTQTQHPASAGSYDYRALTPEMLRGMSSEEVMKLHRQALEKEIGSNGYVPRKRG